MKELVFNAASKQYTANEVVSELTSLKLTMNKSMHECLKAAANATFALVVSAMAQAQKGQLASEIESTLEQWKSLLRKFTKDQADEEFLIDCLLVRSADQAYCEKEPQLKFPVILQMVYKKEIVGDQAVLAWFEACSAKDHKSELLVASLAQLDRFFAWLKEDSQESEESEDSGDSSSSGKSGSQDEG